LHACVAKVLCERLPVAFYKLQKVESLRYISTE